MRGESVNSHCRIEIVIFNKRNEYKSQRLTRTIRIGLYGKRARNGVYQSRTLAHQTSSCVPSITHKCKFYVDVAASRRPTWSVNVTPDVPEKKQKNNEPLPPPPQQAFLKTDNPPRER